MFVFDLANDQLEQILDGNQTVDTAIFVNDEGHMHALRLHCLKQGSARHRRWDCQSPAKMVRRLETIDPSLVILSRTEGHE